MPSIQSFNDLDPVRAREALAACCASSAWVQHMVDGRPYAGPDELAGAGYKAAEELPWSGVEEALAAHPRIGERAKGDSTEAGWSRGEQSGATDAGEQTQAALAEANQAYEQRFGHVFLICATGLSAEQMLAEAKRRLDNDEATERAETTRELARIVALRLRKLVTA
ncbi:2-oxo-4-hydroxy-4-carboxy-5-ureidoimidazoline decarboxylase [Flindersiella endophytica]